VNRFLLPIAALLLFVPAAMAQQPEVAIPPVERKPYSFGGYVEFRPAIAWEDTKAALFKLRAFMDGTPDPRALQLNSRVQFDTGYQREWFTAHARTVVDPTYDRGEWSGDLAFFEAYLSLKPAPSLTVDAGKKTLKWGKGYIFNPAAFLDRPKSPDDPALALEGFTVVSADYIRTFAGPLQVLSVTPVLLPVFGDLNRSFGASGYLNAAGKLYLLLFDSDIDVMFLTGGSRAGRVGFDFSRNLRSNLEVHGEWTRVPDNVTAVLAPAGALVSQEQPATSLVVGVRYLTTDNTTYIVDYFRNGTGYAQEGMETYFDVIARGYESWTEDGDSRMLALAEQASRAGYGRMNAMRNYLYGRVNQPDALGALYLALGASAIVNVDDGSFTLLPELQYKPTENLELRWLGNIQRGGARTEFGEKQRNVRMELRARYYF
jgi:hypothetical protein